MCLCVVELLLLMVVWGVFCWFLLLRFMLGVGCEFAREFMMFVALLDGYIGCELLIYIFGFGVSSVGNGGECGFWCGIDGVLVIFVL
jgi:hypothetical protein